MREIEAISKSIRRLLNAWPQQAGSLTPAQSGAYLDALRDYPPEDVARAVEDFISGRVEGRGVEYLPPAPAVAAQALKVQRTREDWERRSAPKHAALPAPPIQQFTEDERAERQAFAKRLVDQFKRENAAFKLANMPQQTPEQIKAEAEKAARQSVLDAAIAGDPGALAKVRADNAATPGLSRIGNEHQQRNAA